MDVYLTSRVSARPSFPPLYSLRLVAEMGRKGRGITGSLRYKYDERSEEDISLTGVVA